ncbi:diacylglycerol kinase family lipid kinase [soil metagenome]
MSDNVSYKKCLFVINPISGDLNKEELAAKIETFFDDNSKEIKILYTTGKDDDSQIKKYLEEFKPHIVVAVGGDGTVNLVAKHLIHKDIIMGILPMGSGNGLSKDLGIPQNNPDKVLEMLKNPKVIEMDTLTANNHFFLHLADIGFNAHIVRLFSKGKKRGLISYIKYTVKEFYKYKTSRYTVDSDYGRFEGRAFMITIANSNQFGSNLTINPNGKYDDGLFEVIIIKRFPRSESFRLFFQLLFKKIIFSPYCIILRCKEVQISSTRKKTVQIDGEIAGRFDKVKVDINPNSLKVIAPE